MKSYSTLADMKKTIEESSSSSGTGKRFIYLRDGDNYKVRFRQELTEDGANFNEEAGTATVIPVGSGIQSITKPSFCSFLPGADALFSELNDFEAFLSLIFVISE
mgnify:CR=1 FL=1